MKYKFAVFDVDGTLLDTRAGVLSSVRFTIEQFGKKMPPEEELLKFIGPPIQDSFAKQFGLDNNSAQAMANVFRKRYSEEDLFKAEPYDGIMDIFAELEEHGVKIAIATYKRSDYAKSIVEHFGFCKYTQNICGADNNNKLKKRDILCNCLKNEPDFDRRSIVMIGDAKSDGDAAEECGVDFLAVRYGYGFDSNSTNINCRSIGSVYEPREIIKFIWD